MQRTEKVIEIDAPVERVFDLFSDFESFPRWMSHIKEVRYTGRRYTRWTAEAPLGTSVEWEAETTRFEPDHRIAWRSVRGDVETEGEVIFQETSRGTTLLRVMLGYDPPAGRIGALVARLFGTNPEQQLEEDLERFAEVVETRRRGRLHARAGRREPDYDERARSRRMAAGVGRGERDWEDRGYGPREQPDSRRMMRPERERRASFDRELRDALSSQRESMRRYREERRSDEQRRIREEAERDARARAERGPADERRLYERRMRQRPMRRGPEEDVDRRPAPPPPPPSTPPRHALTPRERERARVRPRTDYEYSRKAFSRGVDKLLDGDDAPSSRWRR
ncbi:MAG TPA: SRPBCC family protein [Pyrinomonadaceae bacterium]